MRRVSVGALLACVMLGVVGIAAVQAATLTGNIDPPCSLEVRSYETDGTVLDEGFVQGTSSQGGEGTQADPFEVAWDGRVDFRFQTGMTVFADNEWSIYAMGLPVAVLSGRDDNPMDLDEAGQVTIAEDAAGVPRFVGLVHVNGVLEGNNGGSRCEGQGWVRIVGDPVGTVPWMSMVGLILAGLVFLVATPYTTTWEEGRVRSWEETNPGSSPRQP
jgi:hypothetical protein